jgi:aryl carrier-like protein
LTLEEESEVSLHVYGREVAFVRGLVLAGNWEDLELFFESAPHLRDKIDFDHLAFQIGRQRYLELLDAPQQPLDKNFIVDALKSMEGMCSKEAYNGLCYLLTLKQLRDHPDFAQWTVQRGRMECFEAIKVMLQDVFGQQQERRRVPSNRLLKLLRESVSLQYFMAKQTGSMATLKYDPISQCSEASLLKDLTNADTQNKFYKQHLNEVKIAFYTR